MRLASLSPAVTEILFALGKGGKIVCRDQFSNFPAETENIPKLRGHQKVDLVKLKMFQPELVFTSTIIQKKLTEDLRKSGFHVIHQDPHMLNDVYQTFIEIGMLLDCEKEAQALSEKVRKGMNEVKKRARALERNLRVYIEEWHNPPMVSGNWVPEVLKAAGGKSFPLSPGEPSREVTLEDIQNFNPEMVVLSICGAGVHVEKTLVTSRSGWDELEAVQRGNMYVIDDSFLNRPGPRLVEGAQRLYGWIFEMLH